MKERLPQPERPGDFLSGVLRVASWTATLVFDEVKYIVKDPIQLRWSSGIGLVAGGPLHGVAMTITAVLSPLDKQSLAAVLLYTGVVTWASVALGINLMRSAAELHSRQTDLE